LHYRLLELDALRGLSALFIVIFHYTVRYHEIYGHSFSPLPVFNLGQYGIHLFFIISGFVIFMTLQNTNKPFDFLISRFSRLYPAYWAALLVTFSVVFIFGLPGREVTIKDAFINLSMLSFYFTSPYVDGAYWSLTYELPFYAVMFLLFMLGLVNRIELIGAIWLALQITGYIAQTILGLHISDRVSAVLLLPYANLFIAGMIFYKIKVHGGSLVRQLLIGGCLLIQWIMYGVVSGIVVTIYLMIFYLFVTDRLSYIKLNPLIFLGTISYCLYLIHQNIGYVIIRSLYEYNVNPVFSIFVALGLSLALAVLMTFYIERPARVFLKNNYMKITGRYIVHIRE
jgi:peptidoglycan/LPS O-acetylase OafA/YrhL